MRAVDDLIAALYAMPLWAQIGLGFFAVTFVVMFAEPIVVARRARSRFDALAASRGATVTPGPDADTASFAADLAGRPFTVRRELRQPGRGGSYRGPRGHLVIVETALAGTRWALHGVDVSARTGLARVLPSPTASGDAAFNDRFVVRQDGVPVRDGWLDAATRRAIVEFFDVPAVGREGVVWVKEGVLQFICDRPQVLDAPSLTAVIEQQATLAAVLERTAGWRGPQA